MSAVIVTLAQVAHTHTLTAVRNMSNTFPA
jgi:hypothetical protein